MIAKEFYNTIFTRKSVRTYSGALTEQDLVLVRAQISAIAPLEAGIATAFELVPRSETNAKFGDACVLLYSEKHPLMLLNAGYVLEQLDLALQANGIGVCWYGMGRVDEKEKDGKQFVIMLALGKADAAAQRTGAAEFKRKALADIWQGEFDKDVQAAVRCAPSAVNSQPWHITSTPTSLTVRQTTLGKPLVLPMMRNYMNIIDMGICLCVLETALAHKGIAFARTLSAPVSAKQPIAEYQIKG